MSREEVAAAVARGFKSAEGLVTSLVSEDLGIAGVPHSLLLPTVVGTGRRGCLRASEGKSKSAAVRTSALGIS